MAIWGLSYQPQCWRRWQPLFGRERVGNDNQSTPVTITRVTLNKTKWFFCQSRRPPACLPWLDSWTLFFLLLCLSGTTKKISVFFFHFPTNVVHYWFLFIGCFIRKSIFKTRFFYATQFSDLHGQYLLKRRSIIAFSRCKHSPYLPEDEQQKSPNQTAHH